MLWFFLFVISISVGGFFALLVAIARTPVLAEFFPPKYFYHALVGHVDSALIVGLYSFLILLWHRIFDKKEKLYEFLITFLGFLLIFVSSVGGLGKALWNNYVPTIVHPLFFAGISLFFTGIFITSLRFLPLALKLVYVGNAVESIAGISVVNSFILPISLLVSYFLTPKNLDTPIYFEAFFWFPGHIHQFVNACLLLLIWFNLYGEKPKNLRFLNLLLFAFPLVLLTAQFFLDPISEGRKLTNFAYAVGIGIPTLIYGIYLFIKVLKDTKFFKNILKLSFLIYLFGALMGYIGVGMDLRVPAHYHTVIASILVGIMALTFKFLKEYGYIKEVGKFVKSIPFFYGFGMLLFVSGLFFAGFLGAPRKTPGTEYIQDIRIYFFMALMGLGSILSVIGGASFVLYILYSILGGRSSEET